MTKFITINRKRAAMFIVALFWGLFFTLAGNAAEVPEYQQELEKAMDKVFGVLESIDKEKIGPEEKQDKAIAWVRNFRYGVENKDNLWINDLHPKMIVDPYKPKLEGKDLSDFKDQNGELIFKRMVDLTRQTGEGYITYLWPKWEGEKPVPRIAYLREYKPWGWIVGAGMFIDTIEAYEPPVYTGSYVALIPVDMDSERATPD